MTTFIDQRTGHFRALELPDELAPFPELAKAAQTAQRLEREWQEAAAAHAGAETALQDAIATDRATLAEAKLAGKKSLPAADSVEAAKAALEEARRQLDAADDARRRAALIIVEAVEKNRSKWVAIAEELLEKPRAVEAAALTTYLENVDLSTHARETLAWLQRSASTARMRAACTSVAASRSRSRISHRR